MSYLNLIKVCLSRRSKVVKKAVDSYLDGKEAQVARLTDCQHFGHFWDPQGNIINIIISSSTIVKLVLVSHQNANHVGHARLAVQIGEF